MVCDVRYEAGRLDDEVVGLVNLLSLYFDAGFLAFYPMREISICGRRCIMWYIKRLHDDSGRRAVGKVVLWDMWR